MIQKLIAGVTTLPDVPGAPTLSENSIPALISLVVTIMMTFIGGLSVVFIIAGGIKYVTSGGDEKKVGSAKNTILYAVIGLVIAFLGAIIVRVVMNAIGAT